MPCLPQRGTVRQAQGIALGNWAVYTIAAGPTGQSFGEPLARWAENVRERYRSPGLRKGGRPRNQENQHIRRPRTDAASSLADNSHFS